MRRTWGFTTLQPSPRCGLHCPGCGCNGRVTVDGTHWPGDRESRAAPGRGRQRLTLTEVGRLGAVVSRAESVGCRGLRSGLGKDGKYGSIGCRTSGRTSGHHRHVAGPRCGAPRASPAPLAAPGASFPVKPQVHLTPPVPGLPYVLHRLKQCLTFVRMYCCLSRTHGAMCVGVVQFPV